MVHVMAAGELKNIVVALDFSACSADALAHAARLSGKSGARLHLIHVIDAAVLHELHDASGHPIGRLSDDAVSGALGDLRRFAAEAGLTATDLDLHAPIGAPIVEVTGLLRKAQAELLVVGRNGASDPDRGPGTFAMRCARESPCSVLVVPQSHRRPFRRILVGVDFSEDSRLAVRSAIEVARSDGGRVDVLHMFFGPGADGSSTSPFVAGPLHRIPDPQQHLQRRLEEFLQSLELERGTVTIESRMVPDYSSAGFGLARLADELAADLLVVGTRGRTGLARILMGSTAERALREAPCPVLIVKPHFSPSLK